MKKKHLKDKTANKNQQTVVPPAPNKTAEKSYYNFLALSMIILLGILIYSNSFSCSFQYDDFHNFVKNPKVQDPSNIAAIWNYSPYRFIPFLSLAINYHYGNLDVWGYHLFNLVVHLMNACMVWWLTLLIFSSPNMKNNPLSKNRKWLALLTALLFVSHPLATQSVTYIVQRMASMAALFYFLSIAFYMKARLTETGNSRKYLFFAGSAVSAILALLSKQNAATLPISILLVEFFFFYTKKISINLISPKILLGGAAVLGMISFIFFRYINGLFNTIPPLIDTDFRTISPLTYFFTQFGVIVKYIQLLVLPAGLNLDYDYPLSGGFFEAKTLFSFLFLFSLVILAIYLFKKNRLISFGIFWFFLTLTIESGFIPLSDVIFEHRTYLPSFGFFIILSSGISLILWNKYKSIALFIFAIFIISYSYMTFERNKTWKDEITLWDDVIAKSPNKARPYFFRGTVFYKEKNYQQAFEDFSKAIALKPVYQQAYLNRASIFYEQKKYEQAINDLSKALEIDPQYKDAFYSRGNAYRLAGKNNEAIGDYNKVIALQPDFIEAYLNRGIVFSAEKRNDEALSDYNKIISLNPTFIEAYINRGILYGEMKNYPEALSNFNKAIELKPGDPGAYFNRAFTYFNLGKKDMACMDLKKSVDLGNQQGTALYNQYCR